MRVSEIYLSVQGEGPYVGLPTVFIRFGGCNLRCEGWACDTQHAIQPAFRHEWKKMTPQDIFNAVNKVHESSATICLTGGEPSLQPAEELDELVRLFATQPDAPVVQMFTNGMVREYSSYVQDHVELVMDWKLIGSGEGQPLLGIHKPPFATRWANFLEMKTTDVVKFTIASRDDYNEACEWWQRMKGTNPNPSYCYGVVWGKLTDAELVKWALDDKLPWAHTMQVHNYIWNREQRGI